MISSGVIVSGAGVIAGLPLNMPGLTKIRVMNLIPAFFLPALFSLFL